jgi:hypothetical protein
MLMIEKAGQSLFYTLKINIPLADEIYPAGFTRKKKNRKQIIHADFCVWFLKVG